MQWRSVFGAVRRFFSGNNEEPEKGSTSGENRTLTIFSGRSATSASNWWLEMEEIAKLTGRLRGNKHMNMDEPKWPSVENVVCENPETLKRDLMALKASPDVFANFANAAQYAEGFIQSEFEHAGCSCKPYREELESLKKKIAEIDAKEHPVLDEIGRLAKPFFRLWLREKVADGTVTKQHLDYIAQVSGNGAPLAKVFVLDIIAGWRPK